ncbi:MAG: hypothetical protein J6C75_02090 [Oscillospiraceae bacterium]|nr:hypothetical protein [Oscillospiraceae bacterium]
MKYFLASFSICLIVSYFFLFYFGNILIENSWAALLLAAIIALVVLILVFLQERKLNRLESEFEEVRENFRIRLEGLEKIHDEEKLAAQEQKKKDKEAEMEERAAAIRRKQG